MNNHKYNKNLLQLSRVLRKNMTREEKHIWYDFLRKKKEKFVRQKIIGNYIADFYCAELKLVIEIDGTQHRCKNHREYDKKRTDFIEQYGIRVIRIDNKSINQNFSEVCIRLNFEISEAKKESVIKNE